MPHSSARPFVRALLAFFLAVGLARGDGKVFGPRDYKGSLEESAQEAIIIFHGSDKKGGATEDLILKIDVVGQVDKFAWVVPFPNEPKAEKEDARLFQELHGYVEGRLAQARSERNSRDKKGSKKGAEDGETVEVLSRRVVGSYDVAVVRENEAGALNRWLEKEGYQALPDGAEGVVGFYRNKGYVFACIKVKDARPETKGTAELHPLRFTFRTGGRDGIYFPMKMTGLQASPFHVNLYVFHRFWINGRYSRYGYAHRGFGLKYRDWDTPECEKNAGKAWSDPEDGPFLRPWASRLPTVTRLFQKLHPGERYYLTNIQATNLDPADVRQWADDLWLFPYYTRRGFVPHDARPGGAAAAAYPISDPDMNFDGEEEPEEESASAPWLWGALVVLLVGGGAGASWWWRYSSAGEAGRR